MTRLSNLLPILYFLLFFSPSASSDIRPRAPKARNYTTHQYYALELASSATASSAQAVSRVLGVELVEPIGELEGHWLVRHPHPHGQHSHDRSLYGRSAAAVGVEELGVENVMATWKKLISNSKRSLKHQYLRSLQPLKPRQRVKRVSPPPHSARMRSTRSLATSHGWQARDHLNNDKIPRDNDDSELLFAQNELDLHDPILHQQWHLINTQLPDIELNVTKLWSSGVQGNGVKVAIIDDGLDLNSDDLADNFYPEGSWDFNDNNELPLPRLSDDRHGTRCAGEIAAVPNDVCGVGVAYRSKVAGVRILSAPISDADEASALNYAYQLNEIYSCSWGPPDDGRSMEAPEGLILKSFVNGVQKGRDGKGSVFVFAAGNGGGVDDQCNFDGYTNSIFTMTIGAVDRKGLHPFYSEMCAAMLVVAPSSGSGDHIHTTDVGKDTCSHDHGGTSAAAPLAVGVLALALEVRPDLTWRDLQHIAVNHAVYFNPNDPDWEKTAAGRKFSYKYGYGRLDAGRFVEGARNWKLVKPQAWFDSPAVYLPTTPVENSVPSSKKRRQSQIKDEQLDASTDNDNDKSNSNLDEVSDPDQSIEPEPAIPEPEPQGTVITEDGIASDFTVTQHMLDDSNFEKLEHVTVRVWIDHQRRGDVEVEIKSPNGIVSVLARHRRFDDADSGYPGWKFMSLKHWGENPVGTWTITVRDKINPESTGRFIAWSLQLWGECVDPSLARLWAPAEEGQPDEEEIGSEEAASTAVTQKPKPTEHLPDDHGSATGEADQPGLGGTTAVDEDISQPTSTPSSEPGVDEGVFDGINMLRNNSSWLAGAAFIILLVGGGAGIFVYMRYRSRSRRNLFGLANDGEGARGAYEPISEDVPMGLLDRSRRKLGLGGGRLGRRTGETKELYDAFGDGPSDEDEDDYEDEAGGSRVGERKGLDERTALRYHDDFLEDDEGAPEASGSGGGSGGGDTPPPMYRDDLDENERAKEEKQYHPHVAVEGGVENTDSISGGSGSGSGSWADAAEEVGRP